MVSNLPPANFRVFLFHAPCSNHTLRRNRRLCFQWHHCLSQGTPSLFPSIFVPGQFSKKNVASSQEVMCEQWVLPSHRYRASLVVPSWLDELPGVNTLFIFDSKDSSETLLGFSPIRITGGSVCGPNCFPSLCAARHSQGGITTGSFHRPFFDFRAVASDWIQSSQKRSLQYCGYTQANPFCTIKLLRLSPLTSTKPTILPYRSISICSISTFLPATNAAVNSRAFCPKSSPFSRESIPYRIFTWLPSRRTVMVSPSLTETTLAGHEKQVAGVKSSRRRVKAKRQQYGAG